MRQVFAARTTIEAHLVKSLLEQEGIEAEVHSEWLSGSIGEIPATPETWPSVWILKDGQIDRATILVEEYERESKKT